MNDHLWIKKKKRTSGWFDWYTDYEQLRTYIRGVCGLNSDNLAESECFSSPESDTESKDDTNSKNIERSIPLSQSQVLVVGCGNSSMHFCFTWTYFCFGIRFNSIQYENHTHPQKKNYKDQ